MGLSSAWGAFKALSWFSKGASLPLISAIPGVGPVLGFLFGLVQLIWKVLMAALKGLTRMFRDPYMVCGLVIACMVCIAVGMHWGAAYNRYLVRNAHSETREARLQTQTLVSQTEIADAKDEALAEAAADAGKLAEEAELERIAHEAKEPAHNAEARLGVAPLTLLDAPPSVAVSDSPPVASVAAGGVRAVEPAPAKSPVHRRKQEPGVFEGVYKSVSDAFDASKW